MSISPLTNTVFIPHKKNPISYLSENKTPLLIGSAIGFFASAPILITVGAAIYHAITEAGLAHCPLNHTSWTWNATIL